MKFGTLMWLSAAVFTILPLSTQTTAEDPDREALRDFMRAKLQMSKNILEGVTTEDFEQIDTEARKMEELTEGEAWVVEKTGEYKHLSDELRRSLSLLRESAERKSTDGAALAYVQMTMSCVRCHRYVRGKL